MKGKYWPYSGTVAVSNCVIQHFWSIHPTLISTRQSCKSHSESQSFFLMHARMGHLDRLGFHGGIISKSLHLEDANRAESSSDTSKALNGLGTTFSYMRLQLLVTTEPTFLQDEAENNSLALLMTSSLSTPFLSFDILCKTAKICSLLRS